jgi:hypothetical protein
VDRGDDVGCEALQLETEVERDEVVRDTIIIMPTVDKRMRTGNSNRMKPSRSM